jgi:hypothetical protein
MVRKLAISAFCILNLTAVLVTNQPEVFEGFKARTLAAWLSPPTTYRIRYAEWWVRRWAHLAGLDNRWTMFSTVHRFDWWYVIKAIRLAGPEVLPLPLQSQRSLVERRFWDHKEAKIHLNLYGRQDWRHAYGRYLCRQLAAAGDPAGMVTFELHHQTYLERREAAARGTHLEPSSHAQVIDAVVCPRTAPGAVS